LVGPGIKGAHTRKVLEEHYIRSMKEKLVNDGIISNPSVIPTEWEKKLCSRILAGRGVSVEQSAEDQGS
jgi:hypothetical protein